MSELKPCPFCGSPGSLFASSDHSGAWEGGCFGEGCIANDLVWDTSKELAVATWNRRATPEGLAVVPVKPTEAMLAAGNREIFDLSSDAVEAWAVMLAVSKEETER